MTIALFLTPALPYLSESVPLSFASSDTWLISVATMPSKNLFRLFRVGGFVAPTREFEVHLRNCLLASGQGRLS
jgi:hypothetical protein